MTVKIVISGDGLQYEGETSVPKAAQVIAFLSQGAASSDVSAVVYSESSGRPIALDMSGTTPRQILMDSGARTNPQKIAAFARLLQLKGEATFSRSRINEQFRLAGESSPKNIGRDLSDAVVAGYICEESKDTYYLTNLGGSAVDNKFNSTTGRSGAKKIRHSSRTVLEPANESLKEMDFTPEIEGVVSYWNVGTKGDRILWILYAAQKQNVKQLENKDIEYIARQLNDDIPTSSINALTKAAAKKAYVLRKGNVYTLLGKGIKYVAEVAPEEK